MSLQDGINLYEWEGGLFDPDNADSVSLLYRTIWIFTEYRRIKGEGSISLNEAGRPLGVWSDRNVLHASQTASGRSTVNYQWGRFLRGDTPSAANPDGLPSKHMLGRADDIWCIDYGLLDELAARVGMRRTISSEIWHYEIVGDPDPSIDFSPITAVVDKVFGRSPAGPDANELAARLAAEKAAADKKRRQNVALPLIAQQGNRQAPNYGLNIVIWDDGTYYWINGQQRDAYLDAGAAFIDCQIPGRFEYFVSDAELRKGIHKGQRVEDARVGAKDAAARLLAAATAQSAPLLQPA